MNIININKYHIQYKYHLIVSINYYQHLKSILLLINSFYHKHSNHLLIRSILPLIYTIIWLKSHHILDFMMYKNYYSNIIMTNLIY